ncbi:alpha/beta hydrolase-fold protein [Legionella drancourtii]|nr:alpha/beta hydrolase-fold protein [Legionella drancourtii]
MTESNSNKASASISQKVVGWLFREQELSLGFLEWVKLFSATLIVRNRQFSQDFFDALSEKISISFANPDLSDLKKDLILYSALSYIAFADPQEGQFITIAGIDYSIQKIALTSGWISSTYYAYGLTAITDKNAQSFLIFQGTTTPADHGFLAGILADTRPVGSVGTQLYARGQEKLQNWIDSEYKRTNKRVMCTGQSLGGAMSLHAYIHQPDAVDYFIMNPPALTSREKEIYENRNSKRLHDTSTRRLTVVSHLNDPVLGLGSLYMPQGTKVYRHGDIHENRFFAHAKTPDCRKEAPELQSLEHDNTKRVKSYSWKIIKTFLFVAVLILHAIAFPVRIIVKIAEILTIPNHNNKLETLDKHRSSAELYEVAESAQFKPDIRYQRTVAPTASPRFFSPQQDPIITDSIESGAELSKAEGTTELEITGFGF